MNTPAHKHLLVFRFSSMGDVAMTVPVVQQLLQQHEGLTVTFVSDIKFAALFENIPGLTFFGADIHGKYNGFSGLLKLFGELKKINNITAVADLHNVLRSQVLSSLFAVSGKKVRRIDKGRAEKKALTRKEDKILRPLKSTFQRYADVFNALGYAIELAPVLPRVQLPVNTAVQQIVNNDNNIKIGIAPVGKHREKTYPVEKMEEVIKSLSAKNYNLFLFGGAVEKPLFETWEKIYSNVINMAGKLSFSNELAFISNLDLMVSMDSANMHLASLYAVPAVSVWGATHPYAGFYGYGQNPVNAVQEELYCRPCSVFGNKPCYRGDWACMNMISPQSIIDKIEFVLNNKQ